MGMFDNMNIDGTGGLAGTSNSSYRATPLPYNSAIKPINPVALKTPLVKPIGLAAGEDIYTGSALAGMTPEQQAAFGAAGGLVGNEGQMDFSKMGSQSDIGLFGLGKQDMSNIAGLGGLAATGFDIYDKMWGGSAKAQEAQMRNANAQAAYNEDAAQHKKDFYAGVAKSGLAGQ